MTDFSDYDPNEMLEECIRFALKQYKHKPPPRFDADPNAGDRYYRHLARAVKDQIKLSWTFVRRSDGATVE